VAQHVEAVDARQLKVEKQEIESARVELPYGGVTVERLVHTIALRTQDAGDASGDAGVVVHDEDPKGPRTVSLPAGSDGPG
jgi:hypothetical protein